jgi:hypothetical protein
MNKYELMRNQRKKEGPPKVVPPISRSTLGEMDLGAIEEKQEEQNDEDDYTLRKSRNQIYTSPNQTYTSPGSTPDKYRYVTSRRKSASNSPTSERPSPPRTTPPRALT